MPKKLGNYILRDLYSMIVIGESSIPLEIAGISSVPYRDERMGHRRSKDAEAEPAKPGKHKQPAILQQLREQIVLGKWQPGERLPSRGEFEVETGVSRVTVQKIFDRLVREGFIEVYGRRETRVAKSPPHLSRYTLAFPSHPSNTDHWNRYWTTLLDVARGIQRPDGSPAVEIFFNVDGHADVREYRDLFSAARHHLMAGMIFVGVTPRLRQAPLLHETRVPKVLISRMSMKIGGSAVSTVTTDAADFYDKAVGHLAAKGCRTIAILIPEADSANSYVRVALKKHDVECPPYWMHPILPDSRQTVSSLVHLLFRNPADRPDGLLLADNHFIDPATAGLMAAGVSVPHDLQVVVHENFPSANESLLPFTRVGFDARETITTCLRIIDQERKSGKPSETCFRVPARFASDLTG